MTVLVTGSAGHLGEGLMRTLRARGIPARGIDIVASPWTDAVGSIVDRGFVDRCMAGITGVLHTATLHKPHVATHPAQAFLDTNVGGTLQLLESARAHAVAAFVFTSTTSVFGDALVPADDAPAVWIDEDVVPRAKNIYGATKAAAEDLCRLAHRNHGLPVLVLRTARFFPEADDDPARRAGIADANLKTNELLHRRADLDDIVDAHLRALDRAPAIGFDCCIVSATTPFRREDLAALRRDAAAVIARRVPGSEAAYAKAGWTLPRTIDRVYDNTRARRLLDWTPRHDFGHVIERLRASGPIGSTLAREVGIKGYHGAAWRDGLYPVASSP
ncbi:NAD-dependent epimerase/dehydratase family protein [Luteimonas terrae]|uniref:NAD(P)-dependent oxidoreductase n=1 Tax=Luteimonas terrae TaxID=1530191 RepID=A0A4R5U5M9_9GAMM|nr:NAD(P)-dependent oxidoreductase [Luteimonas terrae]TDK29248.1 NAD(P)-dependent oxidoreductase [Luteimonas terrae]